MLWKAVRHRAPPSAAHGQESDLPRPGRARPASHRTMDGRRQAAEPQPLRNKAAIAVCARPSRRCRRWPGPPSPPASIPARHNIFDFLNRDLRTYAPELSSARVRQTTRSCRSGNGAFRFRAPRWNCAARASHSGRSSAATASAARSCACRSRFRPRHSTDACSPPCPRPICAARREHSPGSPPALSPVPAKAESVCPCTQLKIS